MTTVGRSVLVVEDEVDLVATYERLLRWHGCHVVATSTRREALAAIRDERFALVVADLRLPDGDGLDVVRAARAIPTPPKVIVVTGFASEASRHAALAAGALAYLKKPFSVSEFGSLIEAALTKPDGSDQHPV
jgi:two-component system response regulator PilR (NtrC family)